jgi:D-glycero-alpha-D-manno-heptose-7-phosphate kinase
MTTAIAPLRITLGGGGSDLHNGHGICLAATINHHVQVTVTPTWDPRYILHYSQYENVRRPDEIRHRLIRRIIEKFDIAPGLQISSIGEIPAGTGLGSSGAFTVAVLKALFPDISRPLLADWACELDIGQQDQWSAVYGGVNIYDFTEGIIRPIHTTIDQSLRLFYTNMRHDSSQILTGAQKPSLLAQAEVADMVEALEYGDPSLVGSVLTEQWDRKRNATPSAEHRRIDAIIRHGVSNGAYGGKLIGAGDGGFVMFATDVDLTPVIGLRELPFSFTWEGTRCV